MTTEKEKLLKLEKVLSDSVVGQADAVKAVANAIRLSRSGLSNPNRPIASFLMTGPSGTGKTLLAKTVCLFLQHHVNQVADRFYASSRRCYLTLPTP